MRIPPRYQSMVDDEQDTVVPIRRSAPRPTGRAGAVHLQNRGRAMKDRLRESDAAKRAAKAVKVRLHAPEPLDRLRDLAWQEAVERTTAAGRKHRTRARADQTYLDRVTVNYLRHRRTNYDDVLRGGGAAVVGATQRSFNLELKLLVLEEIARRFPELAPECTRQGEDEMGVSQERVDRAWERPAA